MKPTRSAKVKTLWHKFFTIEENFLEWVNLNTVAILSLEEDEKLCYSPILDALGQLIDGRTKPPQAFRHICYLRNPLDYDELIERVNELEESYLRPILADAVEKELPQSKVEKIKGRYPNRFPKYYKGVSQINISINDAFSSKKITSESTGRVVIKSYSSQVSLRKTENIKAEKDKQSLILFGLNSADINRNSESRSGTQYLEVDARELLSIAKCESLQIRVPTGKQYRARFFKNDGIVKKGKFGLIILDSYCDIHNVLPQPARPHSLEKSGVRFELPIITKYDIWVK